MQFQKFESTESTLDWFHFSVNPFQNWNQNLDKSNSHVLENPKQTAKTNIQFEKLKPDSWNHTETATNRSDLMFVLSLMLWDTRVVI